MKKKVVYICGIGHNGSTVFDLVLDAATDLKSVGQLNDLIFWYDPRAIQESESSFREEFWNTILSKMSNESIADLVRENRGVLKEKRLFAHVFLPWRRKKYARTNRIVLDAIFDQIQETGIIDSSKNISRCIGLTETTEYDLYVIHLIRDVRGFVNSHNRRRREEQQSNQYFLPTVRWAAKNTAASLLLKRFAKRLLTVKYEDILAKPDVVLTVVSEFLNEDLERCEEILKGDVPIDSSKSLGFGGNRILHARKPFYFNNNVAHAGVYKSKIYWISLGWVSKFWGYRFCS